MRNCARRKPRLEVHGGMALRQAVSSGLHPNIGGGGPGGPPRTVIGVPPDDSWVATPVHNNLGQVIGQNLNMGNAGDLITTTESETFNTSFGNVDYKLMHELGTSNNSIETTTDLDGSDVSISAGYDTQTGLFGGATIQYGDSSTSLGFNSSGALIGSGSFTAGSFTGTASFNFSNDTLSISGTGINFGSVECDFDIFGIGGGGGAGIFCTGHPTVSDEVAGNGGLNHAQPTHRANAGPQVEAA